MEKVAFSILKQSRTRAQPLGIKARKAKDQEKKDLEQQITKIFVKSLIPRLNGILTTPQNLSDISKQVDKMLKP